MMLWSAMSTQYSGPSSRRGTGFAGPLAAPLGSAKGAPGGHELFLTLRYRSQQPHAGVALLDHAVDEVLVLARPSALALALKLITGSSSSVLENIFFSITVRSFS